MNGVRRQGFGKWHEEKQKKSRDRVLNHLTKIDSLDIGDPRRSLRAISKSTQMELATLRKTLEGLISDKIIFEVKGNNRRRLFCLRTTENEARKSNYENTQEINEKDTKKRSLRDNDKNELKTVISILEDWANANLIGLYSQGENLDSVKIYLKCINESVIVALSIMKKLLDDRVSVLPQMRSMMLAISSQTSTRNAAMKHFGEVRKRFIVDPVRIAELTQVTSYKEFIEFIQRDPWNWGYLDMPCPKCDKFAIKTCMNLNGTWDLVCRNLPSHKEELHFPASRLTEWYDGLKNDSDGMAVDYLQRVGVNI